MELVLEKCSLAELMDAIELAKYGNPEIALMDMRMPVIGGLEATRKLREITKFAETPIVALTASTGTDDEEKQINIGCTAHLPKPIQTKELFEILTKYLDSCVNISILTH